jgi:hypothetical protein
MLTYADVCWRVLAYADLEVEGESAQTDAAEYIPL